MAADNASEFHLPVRIEDLENYEKTGEGRYLVDEVQDVTLISHEDQIATLRALFHELGRSPVLHIYQSGMIGPLYSFVKALSLPGVVNKEARALMAHECAEKLTRLLTHVANYIRRENAANASTGGVNVANLNVPRSCTKMYVFAICNVLLSSLSEEDAAAAGSGGAVVLSQPIGRPKGGRGRGRGGGGVALAADEDISGVDISGREQAVAALGKLFDPSLSLMWKEPDHIEDPVLTLVLRLVLHMLSQKRNVDGEHNAVCGSIAALLSATAQTIATQFQRATASHAADGIANTAPDPKDLLVTPLVELLLRQNFTAKFLARWISDVDAAEALNGDWSAPLLKALYEGIVQAACDDVVGDTQSAKNITVFMEELSRHRVTFVCKFPECTALMLGAESYEVRKAGITVSCEALVQRYGGFQRDGNDEKQRDAILRELLSHILDLNPFTRTHCLHQWSDLVKKKAVPRAFFIALVETAVGRLQDKSHLVRNAALQLIADIIRKNWFSTVLSRQPNMERLAQHTAELKAKFVAAGKTEDEFLEAWNSARQSVRPQQSDAHRALRVEDEAAMGDVEDDPLVDDDAPAAMPEATPSTRGSTALAEEAAPRQAHDPEMLRLVYFENALVFIGLLDKALTHAVELLESKNERNVIEAIRFIVVCGEYRVEGSTNAVLRFLVMVFEGEVNIQMAVREGFYAVFFQAFVVGMPGVSPMRRCLASVLKIVSVLRIASEGEINAVDRLFRFLKQENHKVMSDLLYDAVWSVVDGSVDHATTQQGGGGAGAVATDPVERRTAMRLYSMLVAVHPRDVSLRRPVILNLLAQNGNDNFLLAYGFKALQCEALNRSYALIDDTVDPNEHPVLRLVVRHLCRLSEKLGSWMPMAEAALSTIHNLCKTPVILYTAIVQYIYKTSFDGDDIVAKMEGNPAYAARVAQLLFIIGHSALKHLVSIDSWERAQLKAMEEADRAPPPPAAAGGTRSARTSGVVPAAADLDVMHKELGMGSSAARRHDIEDAALKKKRAMLEERTSIWSQNATLAVRVCMQVPKKQLPDLRTSAVLCLSKLMVASADYCAQHLPLLFTIASNEAESWVVKTNVLLAIGDLACVHPNHVEPFMKIKDKGLFALLQDKDNRVRAVTVQICSHLVLSEMLRIGDRLDTIVRLVADPDPLIRANAVTFVKNFALKHRRGIGNMIPPLIPILSDAMPTEAFQESLKTLLEKVEKDKPTESLIEKLCERFGSYTDKSRKRRCVARNLAYCLSELDYSSERTIKKIASEHCYQLYRQWLRDEEVLDCFQAIAAKARKSGGNAFGRGGAAVAAGGQPAGERRDKAAIEEWEARMLGDASIVDQAAYAVAAPDAAAVEEQEGDARSDSPVRRSRGSRGSPAAPQQASDASDSDEDAKRPSTAKGKAATAARNKRSRASSSSSSASSSSSESDPEPVKQRKNTRSTAAAKAKKR